jgi:hypothetical protein
MGIVRTGNTEWEKEEARWNLPKSQGGMNANGYEHYPRMLYRAERRHDGRIACLSEPVSPFGWRDQAEYERAQLQADAFTARCQRIVQNELEERQALNDGWRNTPQDAVLALETREKAIADEAAKRHFTDQRMSEKAREEATAADDATAEHVPDVPRKPGRPKKAAQPVGA